CTDLETVAVHRTRPPRMRRLELTVPEATETPGAAVSFVPAVVGVLDTPSWPPPHAEAESVIATSAAAPVRLFIARKIRRRTGKRHTRSRQSHPAGPVFRNDPRLG